MGLLDANIVVYPLEPSPVISETSTGIDRLLIALSMDVREREVMASGDRTISGTIAEGYMRYRYRKDTEGRDQLKSNRQIHDLVYFVMSRKFRGRRPD